MSKPCNGQCGSEDSVVDDKFQGRATAETGSQLSTYRIPKMDCPSEERMIRMALTGVENIQSLSFDLSGRTLEIIHHGETGPITSKLENLGLGASLQRTEDASAESVRAAESSKANESEESGTLWILLAINALMFLVEMTMGLIAQSAGLIADSLDMLADAAVYGLALYAAGRGITMQVRAAHVAGILQLILPVGVLVEVGRRFLFGSDPQSSMMMAVASVAPIANISCLLLIAKHRDGGAHMKASWIFSANDVVINLGVILAGLLVAWTGTNYPDLIIGGIVGAIVLMGAKRILALKG
ncbi:cation transporter [uncultured Kiloniella sp.]|uniref:cation transporter n=1 Tax=uncultured Kiloniella sp. TaxID=1133091 RepID=UPI00260FC812|nr:cation transporter [uncultured Kiloniella sp.]